MTGALKQLLKQAIGPERARAWRRRFHREPRRFSEADLIGRVLLDRPAGVMVDVGAHYGESLAPYLERGWKIYAFEPDPANRARLTQEIRTASIRLFDMAVGDREEGSVPFFASSESTGISGLSAFRETHREVGHVRLTTLSAVLASEGETRVDFLKIDTEGHDLFVLRGFPWERLRPQAVLCEFEDFKTRPLGYDHRALGDFLVERGYRVFLSEWAPIVRYGADHTWRSWRPYPCGLADPNGWGNFVAFDPAVDPGPVERYLASFPSAGPG